MFKYVKKAIEKIDGLALVTGNEKYTDDFSFDNMLYISVLHSGYANAQIEEFDDSLARRIPGVVEILSYKNVNPILYTTAGQGYPEPSPYDTILFGRTMRFVGDNVCAVAAETKEIADAALKKIKIKYKRHKPILDFEKSENSKIIIHKNDGAFPKIPVYYNAAKNIAAKVEAETGSFDEAFRKSENKIEKSFYVSYASHCALEPHAAVSYIDNRGRLVIISTTQVPFHVRRIVSHIAEIPISKIRVIKPRLGGGFGGKQEVLLEPIAALVTWRTKRPAKLVYSRKEVFNSTRTRHQYKTTFRIGFQDDGKITALHLDALENSGAYGSHALTVLSNAGSKSLPLLNKIENLKFTGKGVYTNLPCGGAYRGYGATEAYFGYGQIIDMVCEETQNDIIEFYKEWSIKSGETSPIFKALGEGKEGVAMTITSSSLDDCLETGSKEFHWYEKKKLYGADSEFNRGKRIKHGIGMAALMQGSAIPEIDMASAYIKMNDDGSFNLNIGATDLGTGSDTILAQIAAEVLDVAVEKFIVTSSDTDFTPFDTGAYASSTTYLTGQAVKKCAEKIKEQIMNVGAEILGVKTSEVEIENEQVIIKSKLKNNRKVSYSEICNYSFYQNNQFQIQATASHVSPKSPPPFAAHFAEIEVDTFTGIIKVINYLAAVDCGTPINPTLAEGQAEGAIINGISYALHEDYYFSKYGKLLSDSLGKYGIFTAPDIPRLKVILIDSYEETGPFGAKSISEININGPLPAIANAFFNATGKRLYKSPFNPEYVLQVLKG